MCLQVEGIDDDDGGVGRVRRAKGLSDDDRGSGRGRGIRDASKESETTTEADGDRRQSRGIYDDCRGVEGGTRLSERLRWWRLRCVYM